jgi:hypothetical protein
MTASRGGTARVADAANVRFPPIMTNYAQCSIGLTSQPFGNQRRWFSEPKLDSIEFLIRFKKTKKKLF